MISNRSMARPSILLIVATDNALQQTLATDVQSNTYQIVRAGDGATALNAIRDMRPDIIIIDAHSPKIDGIIVCGTLRRHSNAPIILLLHEADELQQIAGLDMGADLCLSKPVSMGEMRARLGVFLRSARTANLRAAPQPQMLTVGPLRLAVHQRRVWLRLQELQLTAREFDLLACLMRNRGVVVRREQLFREVWGGRVPGISQTLSVHIRWLRRKIEVDPDNPIYIQTVRQIGYRIDDSDAVVAEE